MAFSDSDSSDSSDSGRSFGSGPSSHRGHSSVSVSVHGASALGPGQSRPRRTSPNTTSPRRSPDSHPPHVLPSESTSLLPHLNNGDHPEHGTFTPPSLPDTGTELLSASDFEPADRAEREATKQPSWRARLSKRIKSKKVRNSRHLAREAGVEFDRMM